MEEKQITWKAINRIRVVMFAATIFSGSLAGATIDRFIVQFPAWRHLDIVTWAAYSRHADLGHGLFLYPFEAIGGFLLLAGASMQLFLLPQPAKRFAIWVYAATLFAAMGLAFTFFAAPVMLSLRKTGSDPALLHDIFDRFYYFSFYRAVVQILAFFTCVAAVVFYPPFLNYQQP
jgi:hypothetical protein